MATIVTRAGKGSPLTNTEIDSNFSNLNSDKQEILTEGAFVDGDKTKLDGIEALADVTDTANVTAAGALMDSELTNITAVKALDQGVATTDEPSWDGVSLNAISTSIADTAVDVFVYDTRKDSDGGAWRKRCQHTSWYNETLNTATRGSRREFPAVAVIVCKSDDTLVIYDGDDPDMPMWMVFNTGAGYYLDATDAESAEALNGTMFVCGGQGSIEIRFISDNNRFRSTSAQYNKGNIAQRNNNNGWVSGQPWGILVNGFPNDCAMTVLPNAPIDAATGLPIPTIAVATDGGVSVINNNGTVTDNTIAPSNSVAFMPNGDLLFNRTDFIRDRLYYTLEAAYEAGDFSPAYTYWGEGAPYYQYYMGNPLTVASRSGEFVAGDTAGSTGICIFSHNETSKTEGMAAWIASDYATGWMNGDIKLATLSDTDDTDVTGSDLTSTGVFGSSGRISTYSYTSGTGTASLTWDGVSSDGYIRITMSGLTVGKTYTAAIQGDNAYTESVGYYNQIRSNTEAILAIATAAQQGSTDQYGLTFVATTTSIDILLYSRYATALGYTFSVRLAEEDRSVNGNGLQVFGTVTKNPVATGADLVAYSGFSGSNYLMQPYNSDLDFGTGDFCVMGWYKTTNNGAYQTIVFRNTPNAGNLGTTNQGFQILVDSSDKVYFYIYGPTSDASVTDTGTTADGNWHFVCGTTTGTSQKLYVDGVLKTTSNTTTGSINNSEAVLTLGHYAAIPSLYAFNGSIALVRISATVPSAEQIAKIYEDEKVLFQENAQATLYGASDAVTALAYDDDTNLLHVGTSAGRSVFQGLRRVDNTTSAVGAAISASNNLVAED